jgi:lipid-A-disaccharide synthase
VSDLTIFIITGEPSGDALGAPLMAEISQAVKTPVTFDGIGGEFMAAEGMNSLFPMSELAIMSPAEILVKLLKFIRLVNKTVDAIVATSPDCLVIIDSPEFTQAVAKRVHRRAPEIPIVNYVSPSVWAWRPWRAKRMRKYIDRVLAILPFETEAHERLSGPPCTYVGHPLVTRMNMLEPDLERRRNFEEKPCLLVLPGSRTTEVKRLVDIMGDAVGRISENVPNLEVLLPAVANVRPLIETSIRNWPVKPVILDGEAEKFAAFRRATAAITASGTASLELALARVPMVACYRVDRLAASLGWLVVTKTFLLPNLIVGRKFIPELMQKNCTAEGLAREAIPLLTGTNAWQKQLDGFEEVIRIMSVAGSEPSARAAAEILDVISASRKQRLLP